jgi:hypothetical protein
MKTIATILVLGSTASAATINVPADQPTIRAAISAAAAGDTINIAAGVFTEPNLVVSKPGLVVQGQGAGVTIVQANADPTTSTGRVFTLANGTLRGMTIRNGNPSSSPPGGGVSVSGANSFLDKVAIVNNQQGGVYLGGSTNTLTITDSTIASNTITGDGGGIQSNGILKISGCTITDNTANPLQDLTLGQGAGVAVLRGSANFTNSTIANNNGQGGLFTAAGVSVQIEASTFTDLILSSDTTSGTGPRLHGSILGALRGQFQSSGFNLFTGTHVIGTGPFIDTTGTGADGLPDTATGNLSLAADLGTFGFFGGPTQVFPLEPTSPALGAGSCTTVTGAPILTDQRGVPRPAAGCSIGAVEGVGPALFLVSVSTEPPGANCAAGGSRIGSGWDANNNGTLESAEVIRTTFVCNGANGLKSLVATTSEPAGGNCATGGSRIDSGLDANANGVLDAAEISSTSYVCNGLNGTNGGNGRNSLVKLSSEAAGANCVSGGTKIESGVDTDGSGMLDPAEVTSTSYVCNGAAGATGPTGASGLNSLVNQIPEAAGANCAAGGVKIESGVDTNGNSVLDGSEVTASTYVCNAAGESNGQSSLIAQTPEPAGANCPNGGTRITSGLDADSDGVLDPAEVSATSYVCNGGDGASGADGQNGNDGTNGADGTNGTDGKNGSNSLVHVGSEPAGSNCPAGGQRIDTGSDTNDNGVLDGDEISATSYVCNPSAAKEAHGCEVGGSAGAANGPVFAAFLCVLFALRLTRRQS